MSGELDYLEILEALRELPFNVGKKLLIDFLQGNETNASITKNKLFKLECFGSLAYDNKELEGMIDRLLLNDLIRLVPIQTNKFIKVLGVTEKGIQELKEPTLHKKKISSDFKNIKTIITDKDREVFAAFGTFLEGFNEEQCKSIVTNSEKVLCIAGAGSGKTTVLTKRIEFLIKFKSVDPSKILAITFTRKARHEMISRLEKLGVEGVKIETFNSFCEKILRNNNDLIYDRQVNMLAFKDKFAIMKKALISVGMTMSQAISTYFEYSQRRSKTDEQLSMIFMNDCFFVRDYLKFQNKCFDTSLLNHDSPYKRKALKLIYDIGNFIEKYMTQNGLRDFADQLVDCIKFFEDNKNKIPEFEHILIDEYQDVNSTQIKFVDLLNCNNVFCVGDPRQSIYGWRGSDVKYILNFEDKYKDCEVISLTKNYRSSKFIVDLFNESIRSMNLPDLEYNLEGEKDIKLIDFKSEDAEFEYVVQTILHSKVPREEMFVLARTNRQLNDLSEVMKNREIPFIIRSEERKREEVEKGKITLATVHGIKGLEAETVFVIGCNGSNFPCKATEHPVLELIKIQEYDKEEEERRLFYVALSRAKKSLYLSYSGSSPTYFINDKMLKMIETNVVKVQKYKTNNSNTVALRLKEWRKEVARNKKVPAFYIMSDLTLNELVNRKPSNKMELNHIHGLGPVKIMKYGDELLDLINF